MAYPRPGTSVPVGVWGGTRVPRGCQAGSGPLGAGAAGGVSRAGWSRGWGRRRRYGSYHATRRRGRDCRKAGERGRARCEGWLKGMMASICERTFIAIKPDGVQRGLVGEIIKRFEQKGFKLVAMKFMQASEDLLKEHYIDLEDRPFYAGLVKYMHSGPVVAMVWEGLNVIKTGRVMLGETNPADSKPGTIRGDFCVQVGRNIIHGSDSAGSAETEINLWFTPEELVEYTSCAHQWI
ncbi:unnamed protein product [Lepidochelys olivacea]